MKGWLLPVLDASFPFLGYVIVDSGFRYRLEPLGAPS